MATKILTSRGAVTGFTPNYGYLYNWYATTDARGIAPVGFHVPTRAEMETLVAFLGGENVAGGKLKETGYIFWDSPNTGATNEVGFNFRGSGFREQSGVYNYQKIYGYFRINYLSVGTPTTLALNYTNGTSFFGSSDARRGFPLRFIADSGTPTTATQNNGIVIPCITIGSQTWTATNSCETKYRNGDWITGYDGGVYTPISNATWKVATTGMMCAYNDLESNALTVTYGIGKILRTPAGKILRTTV